MRLSQEIIQKLAALAAQARAGSAYHLACVKRILLKARKAKPGSVAAQAAALLKGWMNGPDRGRDAYLPQAGEVGAAKKKAANYSFGGPAMKAAIKAGKIKAPAAKRALTIQAIIVKLQALRKKYKIRSK